MNKVGLLIFAESKAREDVYRQRKPMQDREVTRFIEALKEDVTFFTPSCGEIRGKGDARVAVSELESAGVAAVLFFIPVFISPALVAHAAVLIKKPVMVMGNTAGDTFSQLAVLASCGAIDQIGIGYKRIPGDIGDPDTKNELLQYLNAVLASKNLEGMTFGCIGGRSLGISTGTADVAQWERMFGVDMEHVDQYEIVLRAQKALPEKVSRYKKWISENYGAVCYKAGRFDEDRLDKMIRSYLAVKSIISHYELDFLGIKCQPEMSNGYVLQCLSVQMLNDPYDAEGPKEPMVCSCEADCDGALTMQILKLLSGGQPTALQDIFHVEDTMMVLANCGAMASCFAGLSSEPSENLKEVYLQPHGFGEAGGAATQFVAAEGVFTYARLFRKNGIYQMAILKGQTVKKPREILKDYSWYRPTSFVKVSLDSKTFMREYGSNHIHCVQGDLVNTLVEFCNYKGISHHVY